LTIDFSPQNIKLNDMKNKKPKYDGAMAWALDLIGQDEFDKLVNKKDVYRGITVEDSYSSKFAHIKIATGNSIKHLKNGDQKAAIKQLLTLYHVIANELTEDFNTIVEYSPAGLAKSIGVSTDAVEKFVEHVEDEQDLNDEQTNIQRDYDSEQKKQSRSFAFNRRRLKKTGRKGWKTIKETRFARVALFMPSRKMYDLVQAWHEGIIDKDTQLLLVEKDQNRMLDMQETFQNTLNQTAAEMGIEAPEFNKEPRWYNGNVLNLKQKNEFWSDLKIDYAFLDYCKTNSERHLKWIESHLYAKLSNTSTVAMTHYSIARGAKGVEGSSYKWRKRKIGAFRWAEYALNVLVSCIYKTCTDNWICGSPEDKVTARGQYQDVRDCIDACFDENLETPMTNKLMNLNYDSAGQIDEFEQDANNLAYVDWACIASSFCDAARRAKDNKFVLIYPKPASICNLTQPEVFEYQGTGESTKMVTYKFDISKECPSHCYQQNFDVTSVINGYATVGFRKYKAINCDEAEAKNLASENACAKMARMLRLDTFNLMVDQMGIPPHIDKITADLRIRQSEREKISIVTLAQSHPEYDDWAKQNGVPRVTE
jgi:hypothetical protein